MPDGSSDATFGKRPGGGNDAGWGFSRGALAAVALGILAVIAGVTIGIFLKATKPEKAQRENDPPDRLTLAEVVEKRVDIEEMRGEIGWAQTPDEAKMLKAIDRDMRVAKAIEHEDLEGALARYERSARELGSIIEERRRRAEAARIAEEKREAEEARRASEEARLQAEAEAKREAVEQARRAEEERRAREEAKRRDAAYAEAMARARPLIGAEKWEEAAAACEVALAQRDDDPEAKRLLAAAKKHISPYEEWPFGQAEAKRRREETAGRLGVPAARKISLRGGVSMEFALIPAGEFVMGAGLATHRVRITKPFYIGKHEVTQAQYARIMRSNPSKFKGPNNPVEMVTWNDAMEFCRKLSQLTRKTVRLPTEAEWEYACRAGTGTLWCFGDHVADGLDEYAWSRFNSRGSGSYDTRTFFGNTTHPVGGKKPNAWGLHDMHGNVWEWCGGYTEEWPEGTAIDPAGPTDGPFRAVHGGSCDSSTDSAERLATTHYRRRRETIGLRVVVQLK
ncbi:MAG: formylglycine-generating enzyme family protein [Planctomycetota bacterium]|jgi:formylglycine-generating enzyme required for sulfatase activity